LSQFDTQYADAILFDLDGTLIDTAPDMVAVLQYLQRAHGLEPVPYALGRANVSNGAIGLLSVGFPDEQHEFHSPLHLEYLERYEQCICVESAVFSGLGALLDELDARRVPWGIVTNKPERLTMPLLRSLDLEARSACTVSGDTLPERKPHPAPLIHACRLVGVKPAHAIYVGDAARDIEAGRAAGMATIAASYGYITDDDDPTHWGANQIAADTTDLAQIVLKAVTLSR
jgi:N-acetyl-D-muramate 6-phosphate phosphatase